MTRVRMRMRLRARQDSIDICFIGNSVDVSTHRDMLHFLVYNTSVSTLHFPKTTQPSMIT